MRTPRRTSPGPEHPSEHGTSVPDPGLDPGPPRGRRAHAGAPAAEDATSTHHAQHDPTAKPNPSTPKPAPRARAGRLRLRPRTVRAKVVCLLMVPVVSLLALWAYATVTTAQDVAELRQVRRVDEQVRAPVAAAVTALQEERDAAVRHAAEPGADRAARLKQRAAATDRAVNRLRLGPAHTVADSGDLPPDVAVRLDDFMTRTNGLTSLRTTVLDHRTDWDEAYDTYTRTISAAFGVNGALTGIADAQLGSDARVLLELGQAGEMLARQDTLLASARLTGSLDGERLHRYLGAVDSRRTLTDTAVRDLHGPDRDAWRDLEAGSAYRDVRATEDKVLAASDGAKAYAAIKGGAGEQAYPDVRERLRAIEAEARRSGAERADPFTRGALTPAGAAVLFGLLAVAASLVISVRIGRALVVELVSLRNSALEIARRKLPHAMDRLRAGEEIDVHAEAPKGPATDDETGQVAEALHTVHRAALRAAVERAELASGISGVFVNLARRSQVLVHRQLNLLDAMERRADDPNELGDLFRLDHLTTRMRRHAESLIILSGSPPGRAWRAPVSLTSVVRAAVSEIEDYARVEVRQFPEAAVVGSAIADVTHLLAELIENAAQFSPPHTRVRVSGEPVGNGYALEVEDRGLGMGRERLDAANRRIEQSEALDLFDSDRLGLFVVSRLSSRHGIRVHLRTSPYGGTTAVVLLPTGLLQQATEESALAAPAPAPVPVPVPEIGTLRDRFEHARVPGHDEGRDNAHTNAHTSAHDNAHPRDVAAFPRASTSSVRPARQRPELAPSDQPEPAARPGVITLKLHTSTGTGPHEAATEQDSRNRPPDTSTRAWSPEPDGHTGPESVDDDIGGLPRRVRQASLAPQLREHPAAEPTPVPQGAPEPGERTPEQVRARMTAYRDGWARGGGRPPGAPGRPRPGSPRPGKTGDSSEGDRT
ncbi:sensor histidine kinase [Streptomyces boluensis]|uniref:histidine kinase n=1 Tax=Streptomyces boluensis TaxID=1775135 RepID=A0A964UPC8_9ACTN|nr:sensor histidine kinase [Streptomyces boluensis]NBE50582.1 ATPase [Streptomyces boluensis]